MGRVTNDDDHEANATAEPPVHSTVWPMPDVLQLIDQCRIAAGLAKHNPPGWRAHSRNCT
jgi:hypothetical protein